MRQKIRAVRYYSAVGFLWVIFVTFTGLCYWDRTRYSFTLNVSEMQWAAMVDYILALVLVSIYHARSPVPELGRVWLGLCGTTAMFTFSGWFMENSLYFNADDSMKSDGPVIVIGCCLLTFLVGVFPSSYIIWRTHREPPNFEWWTS